MSTSLSLSNFSPASFLLLLLILRRQRRHLEKSPSPSPSHWSNYWIIAVGCHHLALSTTLYTYYGGRTYLPMISSPLLQHNIWYEQSTTTATIMGAAVISEGSFLPSHIYPSPTRRKFLYKVMGHLRDRFPTPPYTTPSQYNKGNDENHQVGGGRGWLCSIKKRDRGRGPSLPTLV